MRRSSRNTAKGADEDETKKKGPTQRTRMKTRPATSTLTSSPVATRQVETGKKSAASGRPHQSVGPSPTVARKPPIATPPPRKKENETRRRTLSAKPLCQRSQQRHEAFRASFGKMTLGEKEPEKKRVNKDLTALKKSRKGTIAGGSVPPRLPSVRTTSETPSATPRPPRRRWFAAASPKPSPEPPFRSRKAREEAVQQRFREQIGATPLKLNEGRGITPRSALAFSPPSPQISSTNRKAPYNRSSRRVDAIHGQTPPPAEADADEEEWEVEDDGWGGRQRYGHDNCYQDSLKQQFRLKSQQLQYQRMGQCEMGYYEDDSPLAIYERAEEEEVDLA